MEVEFADEEEEGSGGLCTLASVAVGSSCGKPSAPVHRNKPYVFLGFECDPSSKYDRCIVLSVCSS